MQDIAKLNEDLTAADIRRTTLHAEIDAFASGGNCHGAAAQTAAVLAISTCNRGKDIIASAAKDLAQIDDPLFELGIAVVGLDYDAVLEGVLTSIREEIDQGNKHVDQAQERFEEAQAKSKAAETK